jgi:hypothetical protein
MDRRPSVWLRIAIALAVVVAAGCSRAPNETSLRESFASQLSANPAVKNFHRAGDDLLFSGPGIEGGTDEWRVRIDSAAIEPSKDATYKGTVKASWYADGRVVGGGRHPRPTHPPPPPRPF